MFRASAARTAGDAPVGGTPLVSHIDDSDGQSHVDFAQRATRRRDTAPGHGAVNRRYAPLVTVVRQKAGRARFEHATV